MSRKRGRPPDEDVLTPGEWRTVHAVWHGLTNREIARRRGISLDGVKYHVDDAVAKLGLSGRSELRWWRGVPKGSAMAAKEVSMDVADEVIGLGQVSRTVSSIERSIAWYRDVLGLEHLYTFDKLAFFDCGGTRLMLTEGKELQPSDSILYFRVPDITAAYERLLADGVVSLSAPHMIHRHEDGTEEWMAFFEDPDGRPLAIMASVEHS